MPLATLALTCDQPCFSPNSRGRVGGERTEAAASPSWEFSAFRKHRTLASWASGPRNRGKCRGKCLFLFSYSHSTQHAPGTSGHQDVCGFLPPTRDPCSAADSPVGCAQFRRCLPRGRSRTTRAWPQETVPCPDASRTSRPLELLSSWL